MPERGLRQLTLSSLGSSALGLRREAVENQPFQSRRSLTLWHENAPSRISQCAVLCCSAPDNSSAT